MPIDSRIVVLFVNQAINCVLALQYLVKNSKNGTGLLIDGRHRAHDDVPESFVKGDTVLSQPAHDVAVNNASAAAVIPRTSGPIISDMGIDSHFMALRQNSHQ